MAVALLLAALAIFGLQVTAVQAKSEEPRNPAQAARQLARNTRNIHVLTTVPEYLLNRLGLEGGMTRLYHLGALSTFDRNGYAKCSKKSVGGVLGREPHWSAGRLFTSS